MAKVKKKANTISNKNYQVFISHATADKWIAKVICVKIEELGATTFRDDRDICGGDIIPEIIRKEIKQSKEMIVLLTPESVNRQWILLEVGAAWGWRKDYLIVPIRYHIEIDPIPEMVKKTKTRELNEFDNYLTELANRIKKCKNG